MISEIVRTVAAVAETVAGSYLTPAPLPPTPPPVVVVVEEKKPEPAPLPAPVTFEKLEPPKPQPVPVTPPPQPQVPEFKIITAEWVREQKGKKPQPAKYKIVVQVRKS
jgi:hypothetical protein